MENSRIRATMLPSVLMRVRPVRTTAQDMLDPEQGSQSDVPDTRGVVTESKEENR